MSVSVIAAVARNGVIGNQGKMPWRLPEDLKRFKAITMGHVLLMGRETYDSIGRPLPGRRTVVVTRQHGWSMPGVEVAHSIEGAFEQAGDAEVFVAGGGDVYRQTIDRADRIYLTTIDRVVEGDTFFPWFDRSAFRVVEQESHPEDPLPFEFTTLERVRTP